MNCIHILLNKSGGILMIILFNALSICLVIFFILHEFDAIYEREWKMFKFLLKLNDRSQYLIYLYAHIFICGILIYYLWCIYHFINLPLVLIIDLFGISHLILHLFAQKWESNVFKSGSSFLLIGSIGFLSMANIIILLYIQLSK